jgi:CheY-like chemotaxis protein
MESVGRLAGGVAHDFNNMLGVIIGHADLAVAQLPPDQPVQASLTEIREAAVRSANLTRQLLAFARKQIIEPKVLDLNETVEGMLKMLHRLIGEDVQLNWQPGLKLWPVNVDPSQVDQILANLCVNARDAIAGVGKVFIETGNSTFDEAFCAIHPDFVPGDYVRLFVSDSGCGLDTHTLSHLFEPFFTTKDPGKGTGLGLATVYGIVKQNKGLINVYSEPGHGTTFKIYLPRHAGEVAEMQKQDPAQPDAHGAETILLVEDEPNVLIVATTMLKKLGYTVLVADAPDKALCLARDHVGPIHLLITDVIMPGMDGQSLAKELHALYPRLHRLFMSGYTADVIAHHGVLDKGVHFIQKPFDIKALAAKIRDVLDGNEGGGGG